MQRVSFRIRGFSSGVLFWLFFLFLCTCSFSCLLAVEKQAVSSTSKVPTEEEVNDLIRTMTLEVFDRFPPSASSSWKIEENSFHAEDFSKTACFSMSLGAVARKLRLITVCDIQNITFRDVSFYVHNCNYPISCAVPSCVTAVVQLKSAMNFEEALPYTRIMLDWRPPYEKSSSWVLAQVQFY